MEKQNMLYTAGIWVAKKGKERNFIAAWKEFAEWTSSNVVGAGNARLLQDIEKPERFISFGPWESVESIQQWRNKQEFKEFFAKAKELCESIQPNTLKSVVEVKK